MAGRAIRARRYESENDRGARFDALEHAVELAVAAAGYSGGVNPDTVLSTARRFHAFLTNKEPVTPPTRLAAVA